MSRRNKILLFCCCVLVCIGCDRATKLWAKNTLKDQPEQSYFHDTFRLLYVENTGAALSLGDSLPPKLSFWLLSVLPLLFLLVVIVYVFKHLQKIDTRRVVFIAMIFAGGLGNIIDRILYDRHVTDFLNLGIGNLRTGIFNVADICITAGVIGLLLFRNRANTIASPAAD
jgi:signal peptidase II